MTEPRRRAGWLDWLSLAMVLLFAGATCAAVVGGVLDLVDGDPGEAWFIAGVCAVLSVALFIVAVLIEAVRGGRDGWRSGADLGGRPEE